MKSILIARQAITWPKIVSNKIIANNNEQSLMSKVFTQLSRPFSVIKVENFGGTNTYQDCLRCFTERLDNGSKNSAKIFAIISALLLLNPFKGYK